VPRGQSDGALRPYSRFSRLEMYKVMHLKIMSFDFALIRTRSRLTDAVSKVNLSPNRPWRPIGLNRFTDDGKIVSLMRQPR
jgi:hypothetical protein